MDSDEEDNSRPPSLTPATPADALPLAESQCGPHPKADNSFPQLCDGDAHSRFLTPETTPLDTRDSGDVVAGDNSCALDVTELPGGGCGDVSQSPRLLLPMAEEDLDESAHTEEGGDIEPLEIPQEVPGKNEKDGNLLPREGGREAGENSDLTFNNDNNREPDVDNDVEGEDGHMNAEVEFPGLNEGTETEVVVDEVAENSVMATEQGVTSIMDKPAVAYEDKESIDKMGVEEELKEEPTDVADGLGVAKEENENEAEIDEKKVDTSAESMMLEAEGVVPTEMSEMAEETEAAEEAFNETGQMDEMKAKDSTDEEETDVANADDEMEVTEADEIEEGDIAEEVEEGSNAEVEGDVAEDMDEGDNVEEIGEGDNGEEIEEGDNTEHIQIADGTKVAAANEVEEVSRNVGGKRKRRKNAKTPVRTPSKKKAEEDVCFICFDGGELVLCDRRGCPKAYHPTCVNRDDAFFRSRGRWNCGFLYSTAILAAAGFCAGTGRSYPAHSLSFANSPTSFTVHFLSVTNSPILSS